jgi:serine protease Do
MSPLDFNAAALHEATRAFTVAVESAQGGGAGVVWSHGPEHTTIATCAHVVPRDNVRISWSDGTTASARVAARDPWRDAALLVTQKDGAALAPRASDAQLRPGEIVGAVGHPGGWRDSVAVGVLHSLERIGPQGPVRWVRADVRLWPGNSGGPLVDARGRVLGLNALVARGLAHAVPIAAFQHLDRVRQRGPLLGARLRPVELQQGRRAQLGLLLLDADEGAPAASARLVAGDVLLGAAGHAFRLPSDLGVVLESAQPGDIIVFTVLRGGRRIDVPLQLPDANREDRAA